MACARSGRVAARLEVDDHREAGWSPVQTAGDRYILNQVRRDPTYANVDPNVLVRVWYGTIGLLEGGDTTEHIVGQIQKYAGGSLDSADQFLDMVLEHMPGSVGADGRFHWQ